MVPNGDSWDEWRVWVLKELERLAGSDKTQAETITQFAVEIGTLRTKAGLWGAIGTALPVCIFLLMEFFRNRGGP